MFFYEMDNDSFATMSVVTGGALYIDNRSLDGIKYMRQACYGQIGSVLIVPAVHQSNTHLFFVFGALSIGHGLHVRRRAFILLVSCIVFVRDVANVGHMRHIPMQHTNDTSCIRRFVCVMCVQMFPLRNQIDPNSKWSRFSFKPRQ